jgi:pyruvate/2-oxoglutarate dehydrogenase complex dihydrolipoamide dehydrogenase (E3) component
MAVQLLPGDRHDDALLANVHPHDWALPTPAPRYNLVVVGAGPAGLVAAAGAAGLGAKVALVERDLMGGDCLNVGCVPSKALLAASRVAAQVRHASDFGVQVPSAVRIDFAAVMERVRRLRAQLSPTDSVARFRSLGVDVFLGEGRFTGPDTLTVDGQALRFARAVIATGGRAHHPDVSGLVQAGFLTNESVFTLTELPPRLAVLGAGPVGCELAQAFARFGSQVSLIDSNPRVLHRDDQEASGRIGAALARDGVRLYLNSKPARVEVRGADRLLHLTGGTEQPVLADTILVAAGRRPNVDGLGLEAAGVRYDTQRGVEVNDHLRTSNPRIYAAGDVCSRQQFTHAADAQARIVLQNALFLGRRKTSALIIPHCTYTDPELAHVGLTAVGAIAKRTPVEVFALDLHDVDRAVLDGETEGFVKILVRAGTDRIVGATIVAAHAGEMISEITLAMTARLGLRRLSSVIHPYPTQAEAIRKLGDASNRTRLTPTVRWLFERWLRWRR